MSLAYNLTSKTDNYHFIFSNIFGYENVCEYLKIYNLFVLCLYLEQEMYNQ